MPASLGKGSKTDVVTGRYEVGVRSPRADLVDVMAVLVDSSGRVRSDADFIFFNQPQGPGVSLTAGGVSVDLAAVPGDVHRVVVAASTEAQQASFGQVSDLVVGIEGSQSFEFAPPGLSSETVLHLVAFYRRGDGWRLDAVGQGYAAGLAAFATDHGIDVGGATPPAPTPTPAPTVSAAPAAPEPAPTTPSVSMQKVRISLTKDSPVKTATIDLRKSAGDPSWVLTVGLEWDGRGAKYDRNGQVKRYGEGDLDVYFFVRNEATDEYVVVSGDPGRRGTLHTWPFIHHFGDSPGPGAGGRAAVEQVQVLPVENGQLAVSVYQSMDNGTGALDSFGRPRVAIRYGRAGADGMPSADADEILVFVGNNRDSYWATVAMIDVQDGLLLVDGETRYSRTGSEHMPGIDTSGGWVQEPLEGPVGQSKRKNQGQGLTRYQGRCSPA